MVCCVCGCFRGLAAPSGRRRNNWDEGNLRSTARSSNRTFTEDFSLSGTEVGSGASGAVVLARPRGEDPLASSSHGGVVAVKRINTKHLSAADVRELMKEVEIYAKTDHVHIARLLRVYQEEGEVVLVMEYCSGGTLAERLMSKKRFSDTEALQLMRQVLAAVHYLHSHAAGTIVHRDLKHTNFVFSDNTDEADLKLLDFGLSKLLSRQVPRTSGRAGTLYYMAPEVVSGGTYGQSCDIWSIGVIAYFLLSGDAPFLQPTQDRTVADIIAGKYKPMFGANWSHVSAAAISFVESCLRLDPIQRPTSEQLLHHQWFIGANRADEIQAAPTLLTSRSAIKHLEDFAKDNPAQRATAAFAVYAKGTEQCDLLRRAIRQFEDLDTDGDGTISPAELQSAFNKMQGDVECTQPAEALVASMDFTADGRIHYSEFLAATVGKACLRSDAMNQAVFHRFDLNGDGLLQFEELKSALGDSACGRSIEEIFSELDRDKSGAVDFEEFRYRDVQSVEKFCKTHHFVGSS